MRPGPECLKTILEAEDFPPAPRGNGYRRTSVAMVLSRPHDPTLLAVVKADTPGYPWRNQVAFPGGHVDEEDPSAEHAAFRELHEELGISQDHVQSLGSIGHYHTINHRVVEAFVGIWDETGPIRFDRSEISRVLHIPVCKLADIHMQKNFSGRNPDISELIYPFEDVEIWGVTARILHRFLETVTPHIKAA